VTPEVHDAERGLLVRLSCGHASADLCQGAVPALLPFLISQRGWSYAAAGALVLAMTLGSSIIQPIFGAVADRLELPWLMPGGVLLAGVGIAFAGVFDSYPLTVAVVAVSGIGVAAFHPEGARFANYASGSRRGSGMSIFSVGGNAGFALGPILVTPLVLLLGLSGTLALVAVPAVGCVLLATALPRLQAARAAAGTRAKSASAPPPDDWNAFARLGGVVAMRSGVYFGLQSFVPVWFVHHLLSTEAAGNSALTAMLVAGAVGTLVGGRLVDRFGRRVVLVTSMALQLPLLVAFVVSGSVLAGILLAGIGFVTIMSFSVTVIMGQEYLPGRLGLASGVTLGAAIGIGGVAAALLGVLADAAGLSAVMWTIALLPIPALALALSLPPTPHERARREAAASSAPAAAAPSTSTASAV
jgi:FSR family fosmidomycin resistance protein-like MFS transporter